MWRERKDNATDPTTSFWILICIPLLLRRYSSSRIDSSFDLQRVMNRNATSIIAARDSENLSRIANQCQNRIRKNKIERPPMSQRILPIVDYLEEVQQQPKKWRKKINWLSYTNKAEGSKRWSQKGCRHARIGPRSHVSFSTWKRVGKGFIPLGWALTLFQVANSHVMA